MVRVFSAYQFAGQSIQRINGDVRAACIIDARQLVLAKSNHVIEIVTLRKFDKSDGEIENTASLEENEIEKQFVFPSVDEVKQMVYCKFGELSSAVHRANTILMFLSQFSRNQEITLRPSNENLQVLAINRIAASTRTGHRLTRPIRDERHLRHRTAVRM